jgi:hypothetical protein
LYITRNTTSISADRITDTRLDTQRCGVVSSISEFDTSAFYDQIEADLAHFKNENEAEFEAWVNGQESTFATWSSTQKSAFETWFAGIRDILDEDTAGHLQGEIEALQGDMNTANARLGKELTATLTAGQTTLTFTDAGINSNTIVDNVLSSVRGLKYNNIEVSEGALTLTFEPQVTDISIKVVIR